MNQPLLLELIARHAKLAFLLSTIKEQEMKARKKVVEYGFSDSKLGTNTLELEHEGLNVKAVRVETISADKAGLQSILDAIPNGDDICSWNPVMSLSKYRKLDQEFKDMLADNVTIKEGSPTVSYDGAIPAENLLKGVSTKEGLLYFNGSPMSVEAADSLAVILGFVYAEQLVRLLEDLS